MLIAQVTDLHIRESGHMAYGRVDTVSALEKAISALNRFSRSNRKIEHVLITGDIADLGNLDAYYLTRSLLDQLDMPYKLALGNHDRREPLREVFHDHDYLSAETDWCSYRLSLGNNWQVLVMDSLLEGKPYGYFDQRQLTWLAEQLKTHHEQTLLAFHHPPMAVGIQHMDAQNLQNSDQLADVLEGYSQVKGIVCGHLHRPITALWKHWPVWVGPAHNHAVTLDHRIDGKPSFTMEPASVRLFDLQNDTVSSDLLYIDEWSGPYAFFDTEGNLIK